MEIALITVVVMFVGAWYISRKSKAGKGDASSADDAGDSGDEQ